MKHDYSLYPLCGALVTVALVGFSAAQETTATVKSASAAGVSVLTRGPLHEAFAEQFQLNPTTGARISRESPSLIEEIPPAVKPVGEGVTWIPGYWGWDVEADDFLWVSGTWRNVPPGQRWVSGYWNKSADGDYQWMNGFWVKADTTTIRYHAAPPKSLERGPNSQPESENQFWVPGNFEPAADRYAWRPGYWAPYQSGHVWVPSRNVATAGGYVHVPGYWDYRLDQRGSVFAPARFDHTSSTSALRFTPATLIPANVLQFHLFAQPNSTTYLFGNYYDSKYAVMGIRPWHAVHSVQGMPDPLFGHYNWLYAKSGSNYTDVLTKWNAHFVKNIELRPALTLADQVNLLNAQKGTPNVANSLLGAPLTDVVAKTPASFVNLSADQRASVLAGTKSLRVLSTDRLKLEGGASKLPGVASSATSTINLATQPLHLPVVAVPALPIGSVPAIPSNLVNAPLGVDPNAGGVIPELPKVGLPRLPF